MTTTRNDTYPATPLQVVTYPSGVLLRRARSVRDFDADLARFCDAMVETMYAAGGVGLAAPQVGVSLRIFVADDGDGPQVFLNPTRRTCSARVPMAEGCLSLPARYCSSVPRPLWVDLEYRDLAGSRHLRRVEGFLAHIVDHEVDHLQGVLYPHLLGSGERDRYLNAP